MAMFLTILFTSVMVLAVMGIMVAGLSPQERERREARQARPDVRPDEKLALAPPRFFAGEVREQPARPQVPLEVLMSQLQRHVQLEHAAAETFLNVPTPESLNSRTSSPFVN